MGTFSYTNTFPNDANTKLLIHGDNRLDDAATNKTITQGTAQLVKSPKIFGNGSIQFFDKNNGISLADSADWAFGSGSFTIDFWINLITLTPTAGNTIIPFFVQSTDTNNYIELYMDVTGVMSFIVFSASSQVVRFAISPTNINVNTWTHIALVRNTANALFFINGVSQTLSALIDFGVVSIPDFTSAFKIGYSDITFNTGTGFLNGFMQEFRVSTGIARWTGNFTPPTFQYSPLAVGGTLNPVKIKNLHIISGGTAGIVKLINDDSSQTNLIKETGTINTGKSFNYGSPGFMFPNGCYMSADTNVTQVEVSVDEVN